MKTSLLIINIHTKVTTQITTSKKVKLLQRTWRKTYKIIMTQKSLAHQV